MTCRAFQSEVNRNIAHSPVLITVWVTAPTIFKPREYPKSNGTFPSTLCNTSLALLLLFRKTLFKCYEATPPGEPYSHKKIKPAVITGQKYNSQNNIHVLLFTLFSFRLRIHQLLKPVCVKCHRLSHAAPRSHYTQHFTNKHTRGKGKQVVMSYIKLKLKPNQQRSLIKDYSKTTMNKEGILGRPSTPKTSKISTMWNSESCRHLKMATSIFLLFLIKK